MLLPVLFGLDAPLVQKFRHQRILARQGRLPVEAYGNLNDPTPTEHVEMNDVAAAPLEDGREIVRGVNDALRRLGDAKDQVANLKELVSAKAGHQFAVADQQP